MITLIYGIAYKKIKFSEDMKIGFLLTSTTDGIAIYAIILELIHASHG